MSYLKVISVVCGILLTLPRLGLLLPAIDSNTETTAFVEDLYNKATELKNHYTNSKHERVSANIAENLSKSPVSKFPVMPDEPGPEDCSKAINDLQNISCIYQKMNESEIKCDNNTSDNYTEKIEEVLHFTNRLLEHLLTHPKPTVLSPVLIKCQEIDIPDEVKKINETCSSKNDSVRHFLDYRIIIATLNYTKALRQCYKLST